MINFNGINNLKHQRIFPLEKWRIKQNSAENKDAHGDKLEIYLDFFSSINTLWWVILI